MFWVLGCVAAASQVVEITTIDTDSKLKIVAVVTTPTRESIIIVNQVSYLCDSNLIQSCSAADENVPDAPPLVSSSCLTMPSLTLA